MNSRLYMHITAEKQQNVISTACAGAGAVLSESGWCKPTQQIPPVIFGDTSSAGLRVSDSPCSSNALSTLHYQAHCYFVLIRGGDNASQVKLQTHDVLQSQSPSLQSAPKNAWFVDRLGSSKRP